MPIWVVEYTDSEGDLLSYDIVTEEQARLLQRFKKINRYDRMEIRPTDVLSYDTKKFLEYLSAGLHPYRVIIGWGKAADQTCVTLNPNAKSGSHTTFNTPYDFAIFELWALSDIDAKTRAVAMGRNYLTAVGDRGYTGLDTEVKYLALLQRRDSRYNLDPERSGRQMIETFNLAEDHLSIARAVGGDLED